MTFLYKVLNSVVLRDLKKEKNGFKQKKKVSIERGEGNFYTYF